MIFITQFKYSTTKKKTTNFQPLLAQEIDVLDQKEIPPLLQFNERDSTFFYVMLLNK